MAYGRPVFRYFDQNKKVWLESDFRVWLSL
jgi:hypothetical protein